MENTEKFKVERSSNLSNPKLVVENAFHVTLGSLEELRNSEKLLPSSKNNLDVFCIGSGVGSM
jgi:hypothetical protein